MANNEIGFSIKVDGVDRTVRSLAEMQQAIKDLTAEASKADYGTKAYEEIVGRIQQAKAAVKEFKNDTRTKEVKDQFNDLAGGVASSFDVAEGALKSFGVESKALAGISSTATGLISAALNARQIAELKVDAAVAKRMITEKAAAAGTVILNTVNKALNTTLNLNPIMLLVTAIGLLVVGILNVIGPIKKLISSFDGLNKAMDFTIGILRNIGSFLTGGLIDDAATAKTRENADKMVKSLDDVSSASNQFIAAEKRKLKVMEASGASEAAILEQKKKIYKADIAAKQAAVNALIKLQQTTGELDEEQLKKLNELKAAIKDVQADLQADEAAFTKKQQDAAKEAAKKQAEKNKEQRDKYAEHAKEMLKLKAESDQKTKELAQKEILDGIQNQQEKARKELEFAQQNARDLLNVEIKKMEDKKKLTAEEQKYLNSLYNQRKQLGETQAAETKALITTQQKELSEKEKTFQKELQDIKDQATILGLTNARERARQELQIELDKQIAEINQSELSETQKQEKISAVTQVNRLKRKEQDATFAEEDRQSKFQFNQMEIDDTRNLFAQRLQLVDENLKLINESTSMSEEQKTQAVKQNADQRKAIEQAEFEYKASIAVAGMDLAAQAGQFLQQIAGKNKAVAIAGIVVEQAAAIGKIVANTAVANAKSVATFPITAGQPWVTINTISAGLSIASTIASAAKSIREINAAGGEAAGGGGSAPSKPQPSKFASGGYVSGAGTGTSDSIPAMLSNGESVINANSTSLFGGLLSAINQAGGGAPIETPGAQSQMAAPVIKTYVVASELTSQQEADKRIKDIARI